MQALMGLSLLFGEPISIPRPANRYDYAGLIKEYVLIHQKKSQLSRSKRDGIINRVEWLITEGRIECPLMLRQSHIILQTAPRR